MKIEKTKIADRIVLLTFPNQLMLTSSLIRFQGHYDSPEFRGKIFSLEEYKQWYTQNSPRGKATGKFTFYTDWNGFNFPSHTLEPFYGGEFDPLADKEEEVLDVLQTETTRPFYTIGIHNKLQPQSISICLRHEICHGLFYTDPRYKERVLDEIRSENLEELGEDLSASAAYHESVLEDELHAYSLASRRKPKSLAQRKLKLKLDLIFREHAKLNHLNLPQEFRAGIQ